MLWWNVYVLIQMLFHNDTLMSAYTAVHHFSVILIFFPLLLHNSGNKHQNNTLISSSELM